MGETTKIQWCDATFNGWIGCDKTSQGCRNCYASMGTSARVSASRGLPLWGPGSARQITTAANWRKPITWNRAAEHDGVRRRVFCSSLSDVFEDREDLRGPRERLFELIDKTPHLDWLLLTKRAHRMRALAHDAGWTGPWPKNVFAGVTCEDQPNANARIMWLLEVPAVVRFVSYEPAIGRVDFTAVNFLGQMRDPSPHDPEVHLNALTGHVSGVDDMLGVRIDQVIVGGESGHNARPFDVEWMRSVVRQCREAGVAAFCKQLGASPYDSAGDLYPGVAITLRDSHGGDISEWPEGDWPREFPQGAP